MKVIQGKQEVPRPYISEEQCIRPIQGRDAAPKKPLEYQPEKISVTEVSQNSLQEVKWDHLREHTVQDAKPLQGQVSELEAEQAGMHRADTMPVRIDAITLDAGRILNAAAGEELTLEELFQERNRRETVS